MIFKQNIIKILKYIKIYKLVREIWQLFYLFFISDRKRILSCFVLDILNLLPDFFVFGRVRAYILFLLGCKIDAPGTSMIRKNFFVEFTYNLSIGQNCLINRDVYFCCNDKISIVNNVRIAPGVKIITISHSGKKEIKDLYKPVIIKDYCAIHSNATILPGTILEEGVYVGAGAVVSGITKVGGIYIGNPARFVSFRDEYK